ncbi:MAG: oxygen-dependent coproporphyrinogen oxidase [Myxococcales bacterium]
MQSFRDEVSEHFRALRDRIVSRLAALDGGTFSRKEWTRPEGGGGEMSQIRSGLFEKGGCNFSAVWGDRYPGAPGSGAQAEGSTGARDPVDVRLGIEAPRPEELAGKPFFATGISLVLHPRNPFVPVVHMNVRYLEAGGISWFGGGADLTPCKPFAEDTGHFHGALRAACEKQGPDHYPRFSRWAREYFYLQHRHSERGVGGIFFDYLRGDPARGFAFARDVGEAFLPAYVPLVERRRDTPCTDADREEQLRWRGRYVEFNLIYDRGTLFGLKTGGNLEAIFMSLPPLVAW